MKRLCAAAVTSALIWCSAAAADEWPSRPVRMVNTFAAGGTADTLTRLVADHLSTTFKQQFFVETRAGAGGSIGVQSVASSPPDGYNFALTNITHLVLLPISNPKLGYDPHRDLTNIAYVAGAPIMLSVNAASGVHSYKDFIAHGHKAANPLTYSSSGVGSSGHLVGGSPRAEGRDQGRARALQRRVARHHGPRRRSHLLLGADRVLVGGTGARRYPQGDRAFAREPPAGFPRRADLQGDGYRPCRHDLVHDLGPAGLPNDIVQKMNREIIRAVSKPEVQQRLRHDGMITEVMSVEQLKHYIDTETARWKPVLEQAGLIGN